MKKLAYFIFISVALSGLKAQHSIAREWNEVLLESIRNDFARPTVHARNLFHISAAMYDAWAILSKDGKPYLIGQQLNGFESSTVAFKSASGNLNEDIEKAISYVCYRIIKHRFSRSPGWEEIDQMTDSFFQELGYDMAFTSTDYSKGSAAALGNYIAQTYIFYGLEDGSNEQNDYANKFYLPVNDFLNPSSDDPIELSDPNRWQPLAFDLFIDQSGNEIPGSVPKFLSPEWGEVWSFALKDEDRTTYNRDDNEYHVFHDPDGPPHLGSELDDEYKWGFSMVAIWSSHLDASLEKEIDISPASMGRIPFENLPTSFTDYSSFYDFTGGGDIGTGHSENPFTGAPYSPQVVKLGDYARVLAEFWADGPDSETPPGHWFTILNYVSDHPQFERKWMGNEQISQLEWDLKAYFTLGGAMHDAAIAAWSVKGYYDYIRPISAIRYMASMGQSSDPEGNNYNAAGIPLVENYIELISEEDPLAIANPENIGKIKLWAWKGHDQISDPQTDVAGVDWILADDWWPYQRPTFVTPPFAGYVSGHSTFSRTAAEVLTAITGDEFFPGGMGTFLAQKNEFLVFEEGPSEDLTLQWATYRDASDQCSLSRIWGGIHPPADDIPGRLMGKVIGADAVQKALTYFEAPLAIDDRNVSQIKIFPNPANGVVKVESVQPIKRISLYDLSGHLILNHEIDSKELDLSKLNKGTYLIKVYLADSFESHVILIK